MHCTMLRSCWFPDPAPCESSATLTLGLLQACPLLDQNKKHSDCCQHTPLIGGQLQWRRPLLCEPSLEPNSPPRKRTGRMIRIDEDTSRRASRLDQSEATWRHTVV